MSCTKPQGVLELITPDGRKALLAVCRSLRLLVHALTRSISLQKNDTLEYLLDLAVGPQLKRLDLQGIRLTAETLSKLTSAPWFSLTSLTLVSCKLDSPTSSKLAAGKWPLQRLRISENNLSRPAVKTMAGMEADWPALRHLNLSSNNLSSTAISQLTQLSWSRITTLDLGGNPHLDANTVQKLACGSWPCLQSLSISGTFGLKYFVQAATSALQDLGQTLGTCRLTYSIIQAFTAALGCQQ